MNETDQAWAEKMAERLFGQIVERDGVRLDLVEREGKLVPPDEDRVPLWPTPEASVSCTIRPPRQPWFEF
jgi:hypothetical protein